MNWTTFFAIVIVLFLLCSLIIPFGQIYVYACKWNIWYKWINYINKKRPQDEQKEGSNYIYNNLNHRPQ